MFEDRELVMWIGIYAEDEAPAATSAYEHLVGGLVNVMIRLSSMTVVLIVKTEKTNF